MSAPLRFGVMCSAAGLTQFARNCINDITRDGLAEAVLLIVDPEVPRPSSLKTKLANAIRFNGNLWYLQSRLFPLRAIPEYRMAPLEESLPNVPRLVCTPIRKGKWSQYFEDGDIAAIGTYRLDFILKFAFGITRGAILQSARYGVWSFHHDDEEKYRGGPPAFWEVHRGDPVTGALLQRLTDRLDGGVVLKKCYVPTDGVSYRANLQRIQESSWHMVRWVCLDVIQGRLDALQAAPSKTSAPIYRAPNDWQMVQFWMRLLGNQIRWRMANQRIDEWNVGIARQNLTAWLDPASNPPIQWSPYVESGQMVADPFFLPPTGGETEPSIMVEEFNWMSLKGRISELRGHAVRPAIDVGIHMSYPFILEYNNAIYAVPETGEIDSVVLYKYHPDSGQWRQEAVLLDSVDAVDATFFEHQGRWWLMHSGRRGKGRWSLFLWHAPALTGPWTPHIANPVKTDLTNSRPAGHVFLHEGQLYRPAQDERNSYGGAMCINRIDELSEEAYRETTVRRIAPDPNGPYPDGLHTLNGWRDLTVVDGKKHRWPLGLMARRQLRKRLGWGSTEFRYSKIKELR